MNRVAWVTAVLALMFCAGAGTSQAQLAVYAMGSGGFLGSASTAPGQASGNGGFSAWGGTFGVYDNFVSLGPVKLGGDARYFHDASSSSNPAGNKLDGGLVGLRLALGLPVIPFKPYIQAEAGGVGTNYGVNSAEASSFAYQVQGGLDFTIFPHLDVRAEYGAGQISGVFNGTKQTLQEVGLGLVLRL